MTNEFEVKHRFSPLNTEKHCHIYCIQSAQSEDKNKLQFLR